VPYGVKISPFSDPAALADLAALLGAAAVGPRFVTAVNTFPNALVVDAEHRPVIDVELAGLSGPALKPVGLGQVRQLRRLLPDTVDIVGAGGVGEGRDVAEYLRAGAVAVQAATAFWNRGEDPSVFGSILSGWADLDVEDGLAVP
jgi:dihydroorotate dehydrogenase (fumarate)